jgi:hypothetical protein
VQGDGNAFERIKTGLNQGGIVMPNRYAASAILNLKLINTLILLVEIKWW